MRHQIVKAIGIFLWVHAFSWIIILALAGALLLITMFVKWSTNVTPTLETTFMLMRGIELLILWFSWAIVRRSKRNGLW